MSQDKLTAYNFSDVAVRRDFVVCSVRLKPFCLGHIILLEKLASPLIQAETESVDIASGLAHFFFALLICSMTYEDGVTFLTDPEAMSQVTNDFVSSLQKQMEQDTNWNCFDKIRLFEEYMQYYLAPVYYDEMRSGNDGVPSGLDWKTPLIISFKKIGFSESDTLNMAFNKLNYVWTAYAESEGAVKAWNAETVKQHEAMKR